jgi:hypothetical protein
VKRTEASAVERSSGRAMRVSDADNLGALDRYQYLSDSFQVLECGRAIGNHPLKSSLTIGVRSLLGMNNVYSEKHLYTDVMLIRGSSH